MKKQRYPRIPFTYSFLIYKDYTQYVVNFWSFRRYIYIYYIFQFIFWQNVMFEFQPMSKTEFKFVYENVHCLNFKDYYKLYSCLYFAKNESYFPNPLQRECILFLNILFIYDSMHKEFQLYLVFLFRMALIYI